MVPPPRAAVLAIGLLPVWWGLDPALAAGGLAPLAVAVVIAAFAGAALANTDWEVAGGPARAAIGELCAISWASAAVVSLVDAAAPDASDATGRGFTAAAALGALFAGRSVPAAGKVLLPLGFGIAALAAGSGVAAPWSLLEPHFETWRDWLGSAVLLGLGLAGVGSGLHGLVRRDPGEWRAPWGSIGLGVLLALLLAFRQGALHAATLGHPPTDPLRVAVAVPVLAAAGPFVLRRPWGVLATTGWLLAVGAGATAATVLVPAIGALWFAVGAPAARGTASRLFLAVAALGITAAAGPRAAWPSEVGAAAAVGVLVVAMFWWAATRVARELGEAA